MLLKFAFAALIGLAVACGGGTPASQQPSGAGPTSGTTGPAPTGAPTGGQGVGNFCWNTPEEVAAALGVPAPTAVSTENPGFGGGCLYNAADGSLVYAVSTVPVTAGVDAIAAGLQTPGSVAISGIGEAAVLMSAQGPLVFRKGNWIISSGGVTSLPIASDAAAYRAAMETLARAAAGRI